MASAGGVMRGFFSVLTRDLRVLIRQRSEVANPLLFYLVITMLFPLGLAADATVIQQAAPAIVWSAQELL